MKLLQLTSTALLALFLSATVWSHQHADVAAIEKTNNELELAMKAGSADRLTNIYTKAGQLLPPNSPIVQGQDNIRNFWQGAIDAGIADANLETIELDITGDTATEIGTYVLKTKDGAEADHGKYLIIWKKENGQWKYHRDIWNSSKSAG